MTKADLIEKVASVTQLKKAEVKKVVDAVIEETMNSVATGGKVSLTGFGTFYLSQRKERSGRNPRTGEKITIKGFNLPAFKVGKVFKELANK